MIKESCKFSTPFRHKTIRLVIFRFLFISIMRQQYSINMYMILMIRFQLKIVNRGHLTHKKRVIAAAIHQPVAMTLYSFVLFAAINLSILPLSYNNSHIALFIKHSPHRSDSQDS